MTKRNDDGGLLGVLFELAALLPWWVDLPLAGGSFAWLHRLAERSPRPGSGTLDDAGDQFTSTLVWALALGGQFFIPAVFVAGAVASVLSRRRRRQLVVRAGTATGVAAMSWREFELVVGETFRGRGYVVEDVGGGGADGGVDVVARRGGEVVLVQCKHWRSRQVGVAVVRELLGVMTARGASSGAVATSGTFTADAKRFARGQRIELLDGAELRDRARTIITTTPVSSGDVTGGAVRVASGNDASVASTPTPRDATVVGRSSAPMCPVCSRSMVERTARKGANVGSRFWGCPAFPACRGRRAS
jgi:restriction system protein